MNDYMRRLFFSLFLFLSVAGTFAQKKNGTVAGTVTDASNGEALPTVSVALYSLPDTVLAVGMGTDNEGAFSLNAKPANYFLRLSYVGYMTKEMNVKLEAGKVLNLGTIALKEDATMLDEATVVTEVPPVTASLCSSSSVSRGILLICLIYARVTSGTSIQFTSSKIITLSSILFSLSFFL